MQKNQRASMPTAYDDYVRQVLAAEKVVVGTCRLKIHGYGTCGGYSEAGAFQQ